MADEKKEIKTRFFSSNEFKCSCCGQLPDEEVLHAFMLKLDIARLVAGIPMIINSGHRCVKHNEAVGGESYSAHLIIAADIKALTSTGRYSIINGLLLAKFNRIGISKTFIHVDDDKTKTGQLIWLY